MGADCDEKGIRMSEERIVNGVNVDRLFDTINAIKDTLVLAADEPTVLLGEGAEANPMDYVLTGLAACLTTSLVYHAAARGIQLDEVESRLEGDLDLHGFLGLSESVRNGFED